MRRILTNPLTSMGRSIPLIFFFMSSGGIRGDVQHPHDVGARRSTLSESLIEIQCAAMLSIELVDCINLNVN